MAIEDQSGQSKSGAGAGPGGGAAEAHLGTNGGGAGLGKINVGSGERLVSTLAGGALVLAGLAKRSLGGLLLAAVGGGLVYRGISGTCPAYSALGLNTAHAPHEPVLVEKSVIINRPPQDLYRFFRNFENLPRFMNHLVAVRMLDERRSHWVAKAPGGGTVEWDAEIVADTEGELIAWRSLASADVSNEGSVRFHGISPERGTEVKVMLKYEPPVGQLGVLVARILGEEPSQQVEEDLRHFKQIMEAGEIPVANGHTHARGESEARS